MHIYDDKVYFFSHTQFSLLLLNVLAFIWDVLLLRVHVLYQEFREWSGWYMWGLGVVDVVEAI